MGTGPRPSRAKWDRDQDSLTWLRPLHESTAAGSERQADHLLARRADAQRRVGQVVRDRLPWNDPGICLAPPLALAADVRAHIYMTGRRRMHARTPTRAPASRWQ